MCWRILLLLVGRAITPHPRHVVWSNSVSGDRLRPLTVFTVNLHQDKGWLASFYLHFSVLFVPRFFFRPPFQYIRLGMLFLVFLTGVSLSFLAVSNQRLGERVPWISGSVYAGPGPISVEIQGERSRIGFGELGNCTRVIRLAPRLLVRLLYYPTMVKSSFTKKISK